MASWYDKTQINALSVQEDDRFHLGDASEPNTAKDKTILRSEMRRTMNMTRVTQTAHGFTTGICVRHDGTSYVKALATDRATAEVVGVVVSVPSVDSFVLQTDGEFTNIPSLTAGEVHFLQNDGTLGVTPGAVWVPVLFAYSGTSGYLKPVTEALGSWYDKRNLQGIQLADSDRLMVGEHGIVWNLRDAHVTVDGLRQAMVGRAKTSSLSGSLTLSASGQGVTYLVDTSAGSVVITLPVGLASNFVARFVNIGANAVTFAGDGTSTVNGVTSIAQWQQAEVLQQGADSWIVNAYTGNISDHGALTGLADDDHTQYHTDARALTWLGTRSTTDLPEGTNLYYTDVRADARIAAASVDDLADVDTTTTAPTTGDLLEWNGTNWVPIAKTSAGPKVTVTTVDPTATNDGTQGYTVGSIWVNDAFLRAFVCIRADTGAAIWRRDDTYVSSHGSLITRNDSGEMTELGKGTNGQVLVSDSTVPKGLAWRDAAYDLVLGFVGVPSASQLDWILAGRAVTIASADPGVAYVRTNPSATWDFDIRKNGTSVGTLSISTTGVATWTVAADITLAAGDRLELVAPASADSTGADIQATFKATVN